MQCVGGTNEEESGGDGKARLSATPIRRPVRVCEIKESENGVDEAAAKGRPWSVSRW